MTLKYRVHSKAGKLHRVPNHKHGSVVMGAVDAAPYLFIYALANVIALIGRYFVMILS